MGLEDKVLNAVTGRNMKTVKVSADQLAAIINDTFIQKISSQQERDKLENVLKGRRYWYSEMNSPDGKFELYISEFHRGLTRHRFAWVHNIETDEYFEWKGFSLGTLKKAIRPYLLQAVMQNKNTQLSANEVISWQTHGTENSFKRMVCAFVIIIICVAGWIHFMPLLENSFHNAEVTQEQSTMDMEEELTLPKEKLALPREVSGFLEREIEEVKQQYQLETSKVVVTALETDNVSMLDNEEDGKIDTIIIGGKSGPHTLLGMNCDIIFNEEYIPSTYIFLNFGNIYADGTEVSYTTNDYVSDDGHKILEIQYWENKRIKQVALTYSKEKIVPTALSSTLPNEVSALLGQELETVKREYQLREDEIFALEHDNVDIGDVDGDGRIDLISINDGKGDHTLFGMKCDDYFISSKIPLEYSFYDSTDFSAVMAMDAYTRYWYLSDDEQKVLQIEFWQDERIKSIVLIKGEQSDSEEYRSFYENQDDDLIYDDEDYDYDYEEDDSEYYEDYDYDYEEDDSYEDTYNLEYSQAITQKAINARWDDPDSYILPNSDKKKLSEKKLNKLNLRTIQFAIDELCARHGRKFDDKVNSADYGDMKDYFESKNWYQAVSKRYKPQKFDTKIRNQVFNEVETYNFFLLAKIRDKKKNK